MIRAKQAMNLEYDPKKRMEIARMMGPDYEPPYMPLIQTKCRAAVDWILDVYFQPGARPFGIENTPEPKIPKDIEQAARMLYAEMIAQSIWTKEDNDNGLSSPTFWKGPTSQPLSLTTVSGVSVTNKIE